MRAAAKWIDGDPYAMSAPSSLHQELLTSLVLALPPFFRGRGHGSCRQEVPLSRASGPRASDPFLAGSLQGIGVLASQKRQLCSFR